MINRAKMNVVLVAIDDWQRGAITWFDCLRRCDLSDAEAKGIKRHLYSLMTDAQVKQVVMDSIADADRKV